METFSINLTVDEIKFILQAMNSINIQGKDAQFVAMLQNKFRVELNEIQQQLEKAKIDELSNKYKPQKTTKK